MLPTMCSGIARRTTVGPLLALLAAGSALPPASASAQNTGRIIGRAVDRVSGQAIAEVRVSLDGGTRAVSTDSSGRFVLLGVAPGSHRVAAHRIGYAPASIADLAVRAMGTTELEIVMEASAVVVQEVRVLAQSQPLQNTTTGATQQVVGREELRLAPIQTVDEVLELRMGVSEGHFRGGRLGQETYLVDGVDVRNQFQVSVVGSAVDLAPSAIEELAVLTGGYTAQFGSAISGVVNISTRRGSTEGWEGRAVLVGDYGMPASLSRGYARYELGGGGPLRRRGAGPTVYADVTAFAMADADPRRDGLSCVGAPDFECPARRAIIPHQRGDRLTGFLRLDLPISSDVAAAATAALSRTQRELYSSRFKYNLDGYLAERLETAHLAATTDGQLGGGTRATLFTARVGLTRTDRYIGVAEPGSRPGAGGLPGGRIAFRGEAFVRQSVAEQSAAGTGVPGYAPTGGLGTRYGVWGSDLFVAQGTSSIVHRTRSDALSLEAALTSQVNPRHLLTAGSSLKLFHVEAYQNIASASRGGAPNFVSFYPRVAAFYLHNSLEAEHGIGIEAGVRLEGFQPQIAFASDRRIIGSPLVEADWSWALVPRISLAIPLGFIGADRTFVRWNFGRFTQPPEFQYFFDTALDDSLNTTLRRVGNPLLGFERATQYEIAVTHLLLPNLLIGANAFFKELQGLVTSGVQLAGRPGLFTNLDAGEVRGVETTLEARIGPGRRVLVGYSLQRAVGRVSSAFDSTIGPANAAPETVPLQFDRRHVVDFVAYWHTGAGGGPRLLGTHPLAGWQVAVSGTASSGTPAPTDPDRRLPWSVLVALRAGRTVRLPFGPATVFVEGKNVLGWRSLLTVRPETGTEQPDLAAIEARARQETAGAPPIPRESPYYAEAFDANGDGLLDRGEQYAARRAALLDAADPTLFVGPAREIRLGLQVSW